MRYISFISKGFTLRKAFKRKQSNNLEFDNCLHKKCGKYQWTELSEDSCSDSSAPQANGYTVNSRLSAPALITILTVIDAALISKTGKNTVHLSTMNEVGSAGEQNFKIN